MVKTTKGSEDPKPKAETKATVKGTESTGMFAPNPIPDAVEIARADAEVSSAEPEPEPEFKAKKRGTSVRLDDATWDRVLQAAGSSGQTTDEVIKGIIENALGVASPTITHHGG